VDSVSILVVLFSFCDGPECGKDIAAGADFYFDGSVEVEDVVNGVVIVTNRRYNSDDE
jgi:hypothetical protein